MSVGDRRAIAAAEQIIEIGQRRRGCSFDPPQALVFRLARRQRSFEPFENAFKTICNDSSLGDDRPFEMKNL